MRILSGYCLLVLALECKALPETQGPLALNSCRHELEYPSSDLCCLNCPAGQHKKAPCSSDGGESVCAACAEGSYTEHSNSLDKCLPCSKCHPDQEVVAACLPTRNTLCQCRPGTFCRHEEACEVCQRCRSCKDGEQMVKNCTAHSNRECSRRTTSTSTEGHLAAYIGVGILAPLLVIAMLTLWVYKTKRHFFTCIQISPQPLQEVAVCGSPTVQGSAQTEAEQSAFLPRSKAPCREGSVTDDDPGLGSSHSESSLFIQNSSETSAHASPEITSRTRPGTPRQASPVIPRRATPGTPFAIYVRNDDQLFPLRGEESLKSCFDYFHELDCKIVKRFFRNLGISDNAITYAVQQEHTDATYGLLVKWLEKTGKEASLNQLLQNLRDLNQNMTADEIIEKAVSNGHYERRPPNVGGEE